MKSLFFDFKKDASCKDGTIVKYEDKVPSQLIKVWTEHSLGSLLNSYLKIIHPDDYLEVLIASYLSGDLALPIFTSVLGAIIVWEKNKYVNLLNYKKNYVRVISSGFDFFLEDLTDMDFLEEELDWHPYPEAVQKYGEPDFDECFGYVPLLGLGGPEKVENLQKVKLKEHILLISELMGPIE